jgi:hypothetical protein
MDLQASDSGVELGSLFRVDPARRYPFRQTGSVDAAHPASLQEMGVVISAEQGQVANTALNVPRVISGSGFRLPIRRARQEVEAPKRALDGMVSAVTTSSPRVVLAEGSISKADTLRVELHRPSDNPAFVLMVWPAAPSVANSNPKALASIATSVVRILAEAQARLAKIRLTPP